MRVGIVVLTYNNNSEFSAPFGELLNSIRAQKFSGNIDVLFVDNLSGPAFIEKLHKFCDENSRENISFSYISEKQSCPMYTSWNLGMYIFKTNKNSYDAVGVSSDNDWFTIPTGLQGAIDEFQDQSVGIVTPRSESDITVVLDNGQYAFPRLLELGDGPIVLSIDEALNFHVGFFSSYYLEEYDYRYPDVLQSFGTESLLGYCCLGIGKTWTMTRSSILANGKVRYPPRRLSKRERRNNKLKPQGFLGFLIDPVVGKTFEQLMLPGKSVGFGFQTWQRFAKLKGLEAMGGYWMDYDPSFYDEEGKHKNPEILKKYLKDNMFLPNPDYEGRLKNSIQHLNMN